MGVHTINDLSAQEISTYIDWTPLFQTCELHVRYPKILDDEIVGEEAKKLFLDARKMLKKALVNNWLDVKAVFGIWEAYSVDDDIFILDDKGEVLAVSHCLRQQTKKSSKAFNMSLADLLP